MHAAWNEYLPLVVVVVVAALLYVGTRWLRNSRWLSLSPRIEDDGDILTARTSLCGWLLTLTLLHRTVIVNAVQQVVIVTRRACWFFRRVRVIPFRDVQRILYSLDDLNPMTSIGGSGDSLDCYVVRLQRTDGEIVHLFHFMGAGTFQRGWDTPWWIPDWLLLEERLFDVSGSQGMDSRGFVDRLQALLDVPVERPT